MEIQIGRDSDTLKQKYRRSDGPAHAAAASADDTEVRFVRVAGTAPADAPVGSKTVVVDVKAGKVRGIQG